MKNIKIRKVDLIFEKVDYLAILDKSLNRTSEEIILDIIDSGLRGRGGAGFPTGLKWKFARNEDADQKYVICNADEGEPGTFKDREILTQVPEKVLAGMALCGKAIGATEGFIYLRAEYNFLLPMLN